MLYGIYMQTQDLRFQQAAQCPVCHGSDWTAPRGQAITENVPRHSVSRTIPHCGLLQQALTHCSVMISPIDPTFAR